MNTPRIPGVSEQEASSSPAKYTISSRAFAVTILLLVASVTVNTILAHRVWAFTHVQSLKASGGLLKVGTVVPPILGKSLDGKHALLSYQATNQPTVLYVFTPPCVWCARNMDNLKTLAAKENAQYRFIGLSLSEERLPEYLIKNDLKFPVYSGLSPETVKTYKLGSTPQTIVISPEGKILQDWVGAYIGDQKSQIEAFFHVSLPGLKELPKAEAAKN